LKGYSMTLWPKWPGLLGWSTIMWSRLWAKERDSSFIKDSC